MRLGHGKDSKRIIRKLTRAYISIVSLGTLQREEQPYNAAGYGDRAEALALSRLIQTDRSVD
jgi:hypothetical protein